MKKLFLLAAAVLLLPACGGDNTPTSTINPDAVFVSRLNFQISAAIDPATLNLLQTEYFNGEVIIFPPEDISTIVTQEDLDLFNQYFLPLGKQVSLADLEIYTYFLLMSPGCPYWYEVAGIRPSGQAASEFTLTVNEFTLPDAACPAVIQTAYSVFRAEKP